MKCKLGKSLHIHLLILIVIHIAIPLGYLFIGIFPYALGLIFPFMLKCNIDTMTPKFQCNLALILGILLVILVQATRLLILPLLYSKLEKSSNNASVKSFIYNLKTNSSYRIKCLIFVE